MLKSEAEGEALQWVLLPTLNNPITVSHSWYPASQDSWSEPRFYTQGWYIKNRYNHLVSVSWSFPPCLEKVSVRAVYLGGGSQPHTGSHSPAVPGRAEAVLFLYYDEAEVGATSMAIKAPALSDICTEPKYLLHKTIVIRWITVLDFSSYPPSPASGAQISCSHLAPNSLSQVWEFESPP